MEQHDFLDDGDDDDGNSIEEQPFVDDKDLDYTDNDEGD